MSNWQRTLNIQSAWNQATEDSITIQTLALIISNRLETLKPFEEEDIELDRKVLVEKFWVIGNCFEEDIVESFDSLMNELYDWADQDINNLNKNTPFSNRKKVCWVKTLI
jgi:hypothetical protein